jgi:uncharacterized protein (DUF488 family)
LGIASHLRKGLNGPDDYRRLFEVYEATILPAGSEALETVEELVYEFGRVALTCFELDHSSCHRHCVAKVFEEKFRIHNL